MTNDQQILEMQYDLQILEERIKTEHTNCISNCTRNWRLQQEAKQLREKIKTPMTRYRIEIDIFDEAESDNSPIDHLINMLNEIRDNYQPSGDIIDLDTGEKTHFDLTQLIDEGKVDY